MLCYNTIGPCANDMVHRGDAPYALGPATATEHAPLAPVSNWAVWECNHYSYSHKLGHWASTQMKRLSSCSLWHLFEKTGTRSIISTLEWRENGWPVRQSQIGYQASCKARGEVAVFCRWHLFRSSHTIISMFEWWENVAPFMHLPAVRDVA